MYEHYNGDFSDDKDVGSDDKTATLPRPHRLIDSVSILTEAKLETAYQALYADLPEWYLERKICLSRSIKIPQSC